MKNNFGNNYPVLNIYNKSSLKSKIDTQLLYGDNFKVIKKYKNWKKITNIKDGYKGFIKNNNFPRLLKSTHKVSILKSNVYKFPNKRMKINKTTMSISYFLKTGWAKLLLFRCYEKLI